MVAFNNNYFTDYEDTGDFGPSAIEQNEALANTIAPQPAAQPAPIAAAKPDYTQALTNQILGQGYSNKWSGEGFGSAQANAADMAKILSGIGISDINQFGKITKTIPGYSYETEQGTVDVPDQVVTTYGNKVTGQEVPNTYSERQQGNFFGGTFAGKGNTGYGVQFDAQGNPIFYTQGASSNDLVNLLAGDPILSTIAQVGAAYFGGPAGSAALAAAMGKDPIDIAKSAALSYAGNAAGNAVSGIEGITDVLGKTGTDLAANTAKQFVGSGGNIDLGQALLGSAIDTGVNTVASNAGMGDLTPAQQKQLTTGISGIIAGKTPEQIAMDMAMASVTAKPSSLTSSFGPGDAQEFSDNLIEGYFQPGGEGYIDPTKEEMTVQQEPENLDAFLRELSPYAAPDTSVFAQREDIPEFETVSDRPIKQLSDVFNPMDILEEPYTVAGNAGDMTVREEPENLDSLLRELSPYLADEQPGERTIPAERESDIKDDEVTPDTLPFDPNDILPTLPTTPITTPKAGTPAATQPATPATPSTSSGMNLLGLMALLDGQQQPAQQAPMQDPYAHIKLMEDLFGSNIDLTPAGENTAQRK